MAGRLKRMIGQGLAVAEPEPAPAVDLHRADRWAWAGEQIEALERRDPGLLDWNNLVLAVKELRDDMASGLRKYIGRSGEHMIKIWCDPVADSYLTWEDSYERARWGMVAEIRAHPSLVGDADTLQAGWEKGVNWAIADLAGYEAERNGEAAGRAWEDELRRLIPRECPWTLLELAGCDLTAEEPEPDPAVIPEVIRARLGAEADSVPYLNPDRPVKVGWLKHRAARRGGDWPVPLVETDAYKDARARVEQARAAAESGEVVEQAAFSGTRAAEPDERGSGGRARGAVAGGSMEDLAREAQARGGGRGRGR